MAIDTEPKRWSMLAHANGPMRSIVFNPATSGLSDIEKITALLYYGGISWGVAVVPEGASAVYRFEWVWDIYEVS